MQAAVVVCLPALACLVAWTVLHPPALSARFAAGMAAAYALGIVACRALVLERQYEARRPPALGPQADQGRVPSIGFAQAGPLGLWPSCVHAFAGPDGNPVRSLGVLIALCKLTVRPRRAQARLREEHELAEKDSRFLTVDGLRVHYKAAHAPAAGPGTGAPPRPSLGSHALVGARAQRCCDAVCVQWCAAGALPAECFVLGCRHLARPVRRA